MHAPHHIVKSQRIHIGSKRPPCITMGASHTTKVCNRSTPHHKAAYRTPTSNRISPQRSQRHSHRNRSPWLWDRLPSRQRAAHRTAKSKSIISTVPLCHVALCIACIQDDIHHVTLQASTQTRQGASQHNRAVLRVDSAESMLRKQGRIPIGTRRMASMEAAAASPIWL